MTEIEDLLNSDDRALVWPAILGVSLFLPWIEVVGLVSIQLTGFNIDTGPMILIVTLGVAGSWVYQDGKYREEGWLGGGIILGLLSALTVFGIQRRISQYRNEAESSVAVVNIGVGAYLAVIASAAILYVGYQMYTSGMTEGESGASISDIASNVSRRNLILSAGGLAGVGGLAGGWFLFTRWGAAINLLFNSSLSYGNTIQGRIRTSSLRDPIYDHLSGAHTFRGVAGEVVNIKMESKDFDPQVLLTDPNGDLVQRGDIAGRSQNTQVTTVTTELPRDGEYTVWASSYNEDSIGLYTLSLSRI